MSQLTLLFPVASLPVPPDPAHDDKPSYTEKATAFTKGMKTLGDDLNANFIPGVNALAVGFNELANELPEIRETAAAAIAGRNEAVAAAEAARQHSAMARDFANSSREHAEQAKNAADRAVAVAGVDLATAETAGLVRPDGITTVVDSNGVMSAVTGFIGIPALTLGNRVAIGGVSFFATAESVLASNPPIVSFWLNIPELNIKNQEFNAINNEAQITFIVPDDTLLGSFVNIQIHATDANGNRSVGANRKCEVVSAYVATPQVLSPASGSVISRVVTIIGSDIEIIGNNKPHHIASQFQITRTNGDIVYDSGEIIGQQTHHTANLSGFPVSESCFVQIRYRAEGLGWSDWGRAQCVFASTLFKSAGYSSSARLVAFADSPDQFPPSYASMGTLIRPSASNIDPKCSDGYYYIYRGGTVFYRTSNFIDYEFIDISKEPYNFTDTTTLEDITLSRDCIYFSYRHAKGSGNDRDVYKRFHKLTYGNRVEGIGSITVEVGYTSVGEFLGAFWQGGVLGWGRYDSGYKLLTLDASFNLNNFATADDWWEGNGYKATWTNDDTAYVFVPTRSGKGKNFKVEYGKTTATQIDFRPPEGGKFANGRIWYIDAEKNFMRMTGEGLSAPTSIRNANSFGYDMAEGRVIVFSDNYTKAHAVNSNLEESLLYNNEKASLDVFNEQYIAELPDGVHAIKDGCNVLFSEGKIHSGKKENTSYMIPYLSENDFATYRGQTSFNDIVLFNGMCLVWLVVGGKHHIAMVKDNGEVVILYTKDDNLPDFSFFSICGDVLTMGNYWSEDGTNWYLTGKSDITIIPYEGSAAFGYSSSYGYGSVTGKTFAQTNAKLTSSFRIAGDGLAFFALNNSGQAYTSQNSSSWSLIGSGRSDLLFLRWVKNSFIGVAYAERKLSLYASPSITTLALNHEEVWEDAPVSVWTMGGRLYIMSSHGDVLYGDASGWTSVNGRFGGLNKMAVER